MARFKLIFSNGREEIVTKADVVMEERVVKEQVIPEQEHNRYFYNHYPFENLIAIIYLGEDD